uniref:Serine/threonine-protein phosphatase PGAM5, mitochondrial n=1 Tax=Meloidogyne hapla TaxID=6305 RepID=A0A1I8BNS5_MELHA
MNLFITILLLSSLVFISLGASGGLKLTTVHFGPTPFQKKIVNWFEERGKRKWDDNWDFRDPLAIAEHKRELTGMTSEQIKELIANYKPNATRNILLVRHGQYFSKNKKEAQKTLTPLGREQAEFLGKRLSKPNNLFKIDNCVFSTFMRARETGEIIVKQMPHLKTECTVDKMLEEGAPYPPEPPVSESNFKSARFSREMARVEAAFRKYFHRAKLSQKNDSYEIIVCHANIIRYFVFRALQFPPEGWARLSLAHTSITWIIIPPDGRVDVKAVGDFGHLPSGKITFNNI